VTIDGLPLPALPVLVGGLVGALAVLALAIAALRRVAHGVELARLPLVAAQDVRLDVAGPVVLQGEGPHRTRRFQGLTYRLVDRTAAQVVPARRVWVRTSVAGVARVRRGLARFDLARPGMFRLEISGLAAEPAPEDCALIVTPPAGVRLPLAIATCVLAGAATVAALIGIAWTILPVDRTPAPMIAIDPGAAIGTTKPPPASAGRQLRGDPAPAGPTRMVHWAGAGLTLTVPAAWETRGAGAALDVRDPARPSTYLVGHVVTFPPPTPADVLARVVTESAAARVQSGLSAGFTAGRWGGVDGIVTIETRDDGPAAMAVWRAYRPTSKGVANVTLLFGADAETFAPLEPVALAVLASARFD